MGIMSNIRSLSPRLADFRQKKNPPEKKHLPDKVWDAFVWKNWKGYDKWTKQKVIQQGYERNAPFYAAANIVAQTVADMPVYVEYESKGKKLNTTDHPLLDALWRGDDDLILKMVLYLIVTGDAYAKIVFSKSLAEKRPLGFIPLPSQYTTPVQGDQFAPIQYYEVQHRGEPQKIWPSDIIHIYRPDLQNPFQGMSPGVPLSELIDLFNAGVEWNKNVALAGGIPPLVAMAPTGMSKEEGQEIIDGYQLQGGAQNAHRLRLISGELTLHNTNTDPHDAEWSNAVLMAMRMILMSLGVSSSLMNDAANKTYNNVKDSRKALYLDASLPIGDMLYKKFSNKTRPYYSDNPCIKIDRSSIEALQEDAKAQAERLAELKLSGIISANEARSVLKWPASSEPNANLLETAKAPSQVKPPDQPVNTNEEPINGQ